MARTPHTWGAAVENLRTEYRSRVETSPWWDGPRKESLAVDLKIAFESEAVAIPRTREFTVGVRLP
jgi:hypothetical protein